MSQFEEEQSSGCCQAEPEFLLNKIRGQGDLGGSRQSDLEDLLELYRNYLTILARTEIATRLRARVDASDIVQETFIEAHRDFGDFRGNTEKELMGWLRNSLLRNILDQVKRQRAAKRDYRLEQPIDAANDDRSGAKMLEALGASISSPSHQASRREQSVLLADALAKLPVEYQDVIVFRNFYRWQFDKIGEELGKSAGAVRMIWLRALERLRKAME